MITELEDIIALLGRIAEALEALNAHLGVKALEPEAPKIVDTYRVQV